MAEYTFLKEYIGSLTGEVYYPAGAVVESSMKDIST